MRNIFYLETGNDVWPTQNIPVLTVGLDQYGNKHWFYISDNGMSDLSFRTPLIKYGSNIFFLKKDRGTSGNPFIAGYDELSHSLIETYDPGEIMDPEEFAKALDVSELAEVIGDRTFYTLNTNYSLRGSYGATHIEPFFDGGGNYAIDNLGKSTKYSSMNMFIAYDLASLKQEWNQIMGTLYEQVFRGFSSPGNWEALSNTEYGNLFVLKSGLGKQLVCINNDITKDIMDINKTKKGLVVLQTQKLPSMLAREIAPGAYGSGLLYGALNRHVDFKKYDNLLKNAGLTEK